MGDDAFRNNPHVLIIGAGIVGVALAQALRKASIPFTIFERDAHINARGQGWALAFHWALPHLWSVLPEHMHQDILASCVDPSDPKRTEIHCVDASTLAVKYSVPPTVRLHVRRKQCRRALLEGLDVQWGKRLISFETSETGVTAVFDDGTEAAGTLLVGADGSNSITRMLLTPETGELMQLPARCIGVSVRLNAKQMKPLLELHPLMFMAMNPGGEYLWLSVLEVPTSPDDTYKVQIQLSWNRFSADDDIPANNSERIALLKRRVAGFAPPLRDAIWSVSDDKRVTELGLADWPLCSWENLGGRVTLVGDAAHAMTMYRGEAANHGIADVAGLSRALERVLDGEVGMQEALRAHEEELKERSRPAVLASRKACLDAHRYFEHKLGAHPGPGASHVCVDIQGHIEW
ncbi:FAD/NAD(P)-binding domain-containing protein [Wilcoxina mikolae CBS 423.85]|nr:FAD/NAD(P)-binding domain-containing protein [Wilcoxina mikolae CBS 423.85]